MTKLLLLTHGCWGEELIKSAELVVGEIREAEAFALEPEDALSDYMEKIRVVIEKSKGQDILLISDLNGGTTSNVAAVFSKTYENVHALCGLGMEMLIAAEELREELSGKKLAKEVLSWGREKNRDLEE